MSIREKIAKLETGNSADHQAIAYAFNTFARTENFEQRIAESILSGENLRIWLDSDRKYPSFRDTVRNFLHTPEIFLKDTSEVSEHQAFKAFQRACEHEGITASVEKVRSYEPNVLGTIPAMIDLKFERM